MSRLLSWACASLIALAGMMFAAAPAAADTVLPLQNYAVGGSIHLAKLGDTVNLPPGSVFNGSADVTTGKLTGDVSIPEFSTTIPVLGLPTWATLQLVESQPSSGTFTLNANGTITVNASASATLYIRRLGLLFVSVPSTCRTSAPIVLGLDGTGSLSAGFVFAGTTTISPLTGCGVLGPALSPLLSGPGNAYHITLTPPSGSVSTITPPPTTPPPTTSPPTTSPPTTSPPTTSPPTTSPPTVTSLRQSHRRWREGSKLATFARKHKPPVGTTFSFSLNEQATVSISFTQRVPGRKIHHKCVAKNHENAKHKTCKRTVTAGSLTFTGHNGTNAVTFQGRISSSKKLKPGHYTLIITATDSTGAKSAPQKLSFTIVK